MSYQSADRRGLVPLIQTVDTAADIFDLISTLLNVRLESTNVAPSSQPLPPSIYVDFRGTNLLSNPNSSILQLFILPLNTIYLLGMHKLHHLAFTARGPHNQTLRILFECPRIRKGIFDVRHASDILYARYQISIRGVEDIQLMEHVGRDFRWFSPSSAAARALYSLDHCLDTFNQVNHNHNNNVNMNLTPTIPQRSTYTPVTASNHPAIPQCLLDTQSLAALWCHYRSKISRRRMEKVITESTRRAWLSTLPTGPRRDMSRGGEICWAAVP